MFAPIVKKNIMIIHGWTITMKENGMKAEQKAEKLTKKSERNLKNKLVVCVICGVSVSMVYKKKGIPCPQCGNRKYVFV